MFNNAMLSGFELYPRWVPLCNRCNLQYICETKRRLKDRFNEHRRTIDKTNIKSKPTTVTEHLLSHFNHSHTDIP